MSTAALYERIAGLARQGEPFVVATLIAVEGSSPRHVGAKMLVLNDGETIDTIGGGPLERQVVADALDCLSCGTSRVARYGLREEGEGALGTLCGGEATVFLEAHAPGHTLLIVGAGHIGLALARAAEPLDYGVVVLDSRQEMVTRERFPSAERLVCGDPADVLQLVSVDAGTHVVIVTHSHHHDAAALRSVLQSGAGSVGMMGSARKVHKIFAGLREEGVPDEVLQRVHAPIGLDIGAETPAELALSILSQIVAVRRGRAGGRMRLPASTTTVASERESERGGVT
jgi:xanthine dehydrogenase accessory factor